MVARPRPVGPPVVPTGRRPPIGVFEVGVIDRSPSSSAPPQQFSGERVEPARGYPRRECVPPHRTEDQGGTGGVLRVTQTDYAGLQVRDFDTLLAGGAAGAPEPDRIPLARLPRRPPLPPGPPTTTTSPSPTARLTNWSANSKTASAPPRPTPTIPRPDEDHTSTTSSGTSEGDWCRRTFSVHAGRRQVRARAGCRCLRCRRIPHAMPGWPAMLGEEPTDGVRPACPRAPVPAAWHVRRAGTVARPRRVAIGGAELSPGHGV